MSTTGRDLQRTLESIAEKHRGLISEARLKEKRIAELREELSRLEGVKADGDYEFQPWQPVRNAKRAYRNECREAMIDFMASLEGDPE